MCPATLKSRSQFASEHVAYIQFSDIFRKRAEENVTFKMDYLTHLSGCVCQCVPVWDSQMWLTSVSVLLILQIRIPMLILLITAIV